ncbi:recombinase-like helix-turn-helix domain-containing protein [uncultured Roseibium sp.]|uniref:recombinase-like helix-turn-helix domain-containing protein n=1 Tax=uncultured Roseibium sp. TaxID=1936171 RepID=UPI0032167B2C
MDLFKDRLSQKAFDTSRPALAHQSRGRELTEVEEKLAEALMEIYGAGAADYAAVATALTDRKVVAPISGKTDWTEALLSEELTAINAEFDSAYLENGYGA